MYPLLKNHEPQEIGKYIEPLISGHSKWRIPLISGQNIFPQLFSSQILIKKSSKGGHSISGHLHLADKNGCTEWSKPYFSPPISCHRG